MNFKINRHLFLALGISFGFAACNNADKKADESKTTDSTAVTPTETAKTAATEEITDATKVAPTLYKLISDSMGIRVLEINYKPGDSSAMHSHPANALYVIDGGKGEFTGKDGAKNVVELKTGLMMIGPAETHSVKNTGKTTLKAILVEVNRSKDAVSPDAAMDATKVASDLYKVKGDTLGIRMVEATYKPGQSSAMHSHPDNVIYVINGGAAEFTLKDGKKVTSELKTGATAIRPAEAHSVKNTGKTTIKVLLFEVYRPM